MWAEIHVLDVFGFCEIHCILNNPLFFFFNCQNPKFVKLLSFFGYVEKNVKNNYE